MMRILFVSPEYPPNIVGGMGIYSYYIIKYLLQIKKDISIDVLTLSGSTAIGRNFESLPVNIISLKRFIPNQLSFIEFYIKAAFFIYKNRDRYDLIHENYNMPVSFGIPAIFTVHTTKLHEYKHYESLRGSFVESIMGKCYFKFLHYLEKIAFKKACAFIAPSVKTKEHLETFFGIKENIFIIRHGVDSGLFRPVDGILREKKYNVAFVGRHMPRKGFKYLFKALELLKDRNLKILFCGTSFKEIERYINKLKQSTGHRFYVRNSEDFYLMPSLYQDSDMLVLPSLYEPFGFAGLEAMACSTPVIISEVSGLRELMENKVNGIFVRPGNSKDLTAAISYLLDKPEERLRIGLSGREKAVKYFDWHNCAVKTYNLYSSILNSH